MYGVSVTAPVLEAGYEVPAPLTKVFQPAKVKPVLANGTFGEAEDPSFGDKYVIAAEDTAVVEFGTAPLVFVFPS
jgi:hypothetical protein